MVPRELLDDLTGVERESPIVQAVEQGRQGDLRDIDQQIDVLRVPGTGPEPRGQSADQGVGDAGPGQHLDQVVEG